jgi:hypothetical protein
LRLHPAKSAGDAHERSVPNEQGETDGETGETGETDRGSVSEGRKTPTIRTGDARPPGETDRGGKMGRPTAGRPTEGPFRNAALDQQTGITDAQRRVRKDGKTFDDGTRARGVGDATIRSTDKTDRNAQNRLNRIRSSGDEDVEDLE